MQKYLIFVQESLKDMWYKKILFLPYLLAVGLVVALLTIIAIPAIVVGVLYPYSIISIIILIAALVVVLFIAMIVVGAYIRAMAIGMTRDAVQEKELNTQNMWKYGRKYFKRLLLINLLKIVLALGPFLVLAGITVPIFFFAIVPGIIVAVLAFTVLIYWSYLVTLGLYFIEPIILDTEKDTMESVKESIEYSKINLRKLFCTWGTVMLTDFVLRLAANALTGALILPLVIASVAVPGMEFVTQFFRILIAVTIAIIMSVLFTLIIFRAFYAEKFKYGDFGGFLIRLLASYVDAQLWAPIVFIFLGAVGIRVYTSRIWENLQGFADIIPLLGFAGVLLLVFIFLNIIYYTIPTSTYGGTPGKLLVGLKVVDKNGNMISNGRALLRYFSYLVSEIPLGFGYIWIAIDKKHQGWHDKVCNTYVIYKESTVLKTGQTDSAQKQQQASPN